MCSSIHMDYSKVFMLSTKNEILNASCVNNGSNYSQDLWAKGLELLTLESSLFSISIRCLYSVLLGFL